MAVKIDVRKLVPQFKHPIIVRIATVITLGVFALLVHHNPALDKFAFELAMAMALLFITASGWALKKNAGNTAVYVHILGWGMLVGGFSLTNAQSLVSLAAEAIGPQIIGAVSGIFTAALLNDMDNSGD